MKSVVGVLLLVATSLFGADRIARVRLELICPESEKNLDYEEWSESMNIAMDTLRELIESRKIREARVNATVE